MQDCSDELRNLLLEDVHQHAFVSYLTKLTNVVWLSLQRLAGASLLVFANKQDIRGSMSDMEIRDVRVILFHSVPFPVPMPPAIGP